jgi:hypothetical protein
MFLCLVDVHVVVNNVKSLSVAVETQKYVSLLVWTCWFLDLFYYYCYYYYYYYYYIGVASTGVIAIRIFMKIEQLVEQLKQVHMDSILFVMTGCGKKDGRFCKQV